MSNAEVLQQANVTRNSVVLIGPMGAGKSTVGKILAHKLGLYWVDLDQEIINAAGMSHADIIKVYGEPHFRQIEHIVLAEIAESVDEVVLSTGGGVVLRQDNHSILKQFTTIVYLSTPVHVQTARVGTGEGRPLLSGSYNESAIGDLGRFGVDNIEAKLNKLFAAREPHYLSLADVIVGTELLTAEQVAIEIINQVVEKMARS